MFEFKCTDPAHGVAFERHDEKFLLELVGRLQPLQEMNILLVGETGVKKSTWINGLINYLTYDSLKDAEKNEILTLISSEFTGCDEDYAKISGTTNAGGNEVQFLGQSTTLECKVYPFKIGSRLIRLIDAPGIGETRGIDQDKEDFQSILQTLLYLDELHGICVLLKPNDSPFTVTFRFCIKELLTYFHHDDSHNIMFCFISAGQTSNIPKDAMLALNNLLKENKIEEIAISPDTVYCYDLEAYRCLASIKNEKYPVKFSDDERDNFTISWENSIKETTRMLRRVSTLKPHNIKNSLGLDHAREVINQVAVVIAHVTRNIHVMKAEIEQEKQDWENRGANSEGKQILTRAINEELVKYDHELDEIQKAGVKFGYFLKHNAITPYNDPLILYIDHLISEENGKKTMGAPDETLKFLQNRREAYKKQIDILWTKIDHSSVDNMVVNLADIDNLVQMLKHLKLTGKCFEDSLQAIIAAGRNSEYQEVTLPGITRWSIKNPCKIV